MGEVEEQIEKGVRYEVIADKKTMMQVDSGKPMNALSKTNWPSDLGILQITRKAHP